VSNFVHSFVYPDSPFFPKITPNDIAEAHENLVRDGIPLPLAVSVTIAHVGRQQFNAVRPHSDFLSQYFRCDHHGLVRWVMGYTAVPQIITAIFVDRLSGQQEALDILLTDTPDDKLLLQGNQYRTQIYEQVRNSLIMSPSGLSAYQVVLDKPMSDDTFFLAGVVASRHNYQEILSGI
jgi:hypothetical protein